MSKLIILDLDDTIFKTKSISKESVNTILLKFENALNQKYGESLTKQIISECWKFPFDVIAEKYQLDQDVRLALTKSMNTSNFEFKITPFKDFEVLKKINIEKILVTTGFDTFQRSKIKSLNIENMFSEIYIDDILDPNRIFKKGIFLHIINEKKVRHEDVYVIGDTSESELKAGYELGLQTIQVAKLGQKKSIYANYSIDDFHDLFAIIN